MSLKSLRERWVATLVAPIDNAGLAVFRIAFGTLMAIEATRYLVLGKVRSLYVDPQFHFTYLGFDWVQPWPGVGMYLHFVVLGILGVAIALGFFYRLAVFLFFVGFAHVFLIDKAYYLNHFYLILLLTFVLFFLPTHQRLSLDARRRPGLASYTAPTWTLWLLRTQLGIVYFYAGVAKINADWLRGQPLRMWLEGRRQRPLIGPLLEQDWVGYAMSYGGLGLDLLAVPFLLWGRTRWVVIALLFLFHLMNAVIFGIGIFPWLMMATTFLFFPPDWPRRLLGLSPGEDGEVASAAGPPQIGPRGEACESRASTGGVWPRRVRAGVVSSVLLAFVGVQLLLPLRHWLYPGNVAWTEEGHRFAWRMKLRTKSGRAHFSVTDPATGKVTLVAPEDYLSSKQYEKMTVVPDMVIFFAHFLAERARAEGISEPEVRARVRARLNDRSAQWLVDRKVDLAREARSFRHATWIRPLLPRRSDAR